MKFWFGLYSWLFSISWNDTKVVFFTKTWEKLEFVICAKMVRVFFKKWTTFHSYDSRIKINNNICRYRHTLKMLGIVFSIYICTLHRISSKNVDLNICAQPLLDAQCQLWAISKVSSLLYIPVIQFKIQCKIIIYI